MKEDKMQNLNTHTIKETLKISESNQKVLINKDTHTRTYTSHEIESVNSELYPYIKSRSNYNF